MTDFPSQLEEFLAILVQHQQTSIYQEENRCHQLREVIHLLHRYFLLQQDEAMAGDPKLSLRSDIPEYYLTKP